MEQGCPPGRGVAWHKIPPFVQDTAGRGVSRDSPAGLNHGAMLLPSLHHRVPCLPLPPAPGISSLFWDVLQAVFSFSVPSSADFISLPMLTLLCQYVWHGTEQKGTASPTTARHPCKTTPCSASCQQNPGPWACFISDRWGRRVPEQLT